MLEIASWDARRDYIIAGSEEEAIEFAAQHWIHCAQRALQKHGRFAVALSGGTTPRKVYQKLVEKKNSLDWSRIWLFWSDERAVSPDDPQSNYHMAMESFGQLPIPPPQIFRMRAESHLEEHAREYEHLLQKLFQGRLDLTLLGVGDDGHTASLFPGTEALLSTDRLVVANEVPQKKTHRMTLTFPAIHQSGAIALYAFGKSKETIVPKVLDAAIDSPYPASRLGTPQAKALWILDTSSAQQLRPHGS